MVSLSCSWNPAPGAEASDVAVFCPPEPGGGGHGKCEISISGRNSVVLVSSARNCEVLEHSSGSNGPPSYVATLKGAETDRAGVFRIDAELQVSKPCRVEQCAIVHLTNVASFTGLPALPGA